MNYGCDLSELEERLYSEIHHSTEESTEKQVKEQNATVINMYSSKRYFNTAINSGIKNISVRINVQNEPNQRSSKGSNFRKNASPPKAQKMRKCLNKQYFKNIQSVTDFDNINMKEIKASVDSCPEFIKYLPPHIRRKLKKMKKRIAFIQKKKYLETISKFHSNKSVSVAFGKFKVSPKSVDQSTVKSIKIETAQEIKTISIHQNDSVISISDEEVVDSDAKNKTECKSNFIELLSSDDETLANTTTKDMSALKTIIWTSNVHDFKRPDDDDVVFVEPMPVDVIYLENDAESNCSASTKSSTDRTTDDKVTRLEKHTLLHIERKELLSTPESNNSNDFLENTLPAENVSWNFNFELHGTDFGPSKDSKLNEKDASESESSCSVAACDLGGLLASNKCALFNEVDFDSPSKNIFEESNMASFGEYITPNRTGNKIARNILHSSPVTDAKKSSKKKKQSEKLPNLSSIAPEEVNDLESSTLVTNELTLRAKKKRRTKKVDADANDNRNDYDTELPCGGTGKTKKTRTTEPDILANAEESIESDSTSSASTLLKLKKKHKKLQIHNQEVILAETEHFEEHQYPLFDSQIKRKRRNKKSLIMNNTDSDVDANIQIISEASINTDLLSIVLDEVPNKKKSKKSANIESNKNEMGVASNLITEYGSKKKKNKKVQNLPDEDGNEINSSGQLVEEIILKDDDRENRKRKSKKSPIRVDNDIVVKNSNQQGVEDTTINIDVSRNEESKKKKHKSKKASDQLPDSKREEISENLSAVTDTSLELCESIRKKKRKSASKTSVSQTEDTDDTEATYVSEAEIVKRKRNKSATSDLSTDSSEYIASQKSNSLSVIDADQVEPKVVHKSKAIDNENRFVNIITESCSASGLFESYINLENSKNDIRASLEKFSSKESDPGTAISDSVVSISSDSDSDYDISNDKDEGGDVHIANVSFKGTECSLDVEDEVYLENILNKMSGDSSKWRILLADLQPSPKSRKSKFRCRKCREFGHFANQCKVKLFSICCLCSQRGHMEPRCPNKLCTNCGRRSKFFTTFCSRCVYTKHILCKICKMKGHDRNMCPDLWRRYHRTASDGPIVQPTLENTAPAVKWCSGCGKQGHLEYQCQYFARDHCPTLPNVVNYKDHLCKQRRPEANLGNPYALLRPEISSTQVIPSSVKSTNTVTSSLAPPNIAIEESMQQQIISQQVLLSTASTAPYSIITKPPVVKIFLPIPQPIESVKQEAGIDVMSNNELSESILPIPPSQCTYLSPLYQPSPLLTSVPLASEQLSTFAFSTELQISYLNARYLRLCEAGRYIINELCAFGAADIQICNDGQLNIRCGVEDSCASMKSVIVNHLRSVRQLTIPIDKQRLICFVEEILLNLTKPSTIENLTASLKVLQDDAFTNKSVHFQRLNMMIYGYFNWEYGERHGDRVKAILITLKETDSINDCLLNELKECLQYLVESERPIRMYKDIIDNISEGKTNFFNVSSLRIPEDQPSRKSIHIEVDPMKIDYVKLSFPSRFMSYRWKTKLDVTLCDSKEKLSLYLDGNEKDVDNAVTEYQAVVGEGSTLPRTKWAIYDIVSSILKRLQEHTFDNLKNVVTRHLEFSPELLDHKICQFRKLHSHLIVTRGLNGGREKVLILQEFVNNYKASQQNDYLSEHDQNQIQEAVNTIQFNPIKDVYNYRELYLTAVKTNVDKIILDIDEYNKLKDAKEDCPWHDKINLLSPEIINSKQMSISIVGTDEDRCNFKVFIYNYLERVFMFDSNPESLRRKLEDALKKLWMKSFKINKAQLILSRIKEMESKKMNSYHIDILRKLYQQLHMYFFGCCRLDLQTGEEILSNNHVDALRAYIAYLGTVTVVPAEVQMQIYRTYIHIFGKEKLNQLDYKMLIQSAWRFYKKYENMDQNTMFICDPRVKRYLTQVAYSFKSHSIVQANPLMQNNDVQNFVDYAFMIIINKDASIKHNLPILMRCESFKLFSDSYSNITANLSICLQAIDEITSCLNAKNALDLLHHVHSLEENSPNSELIEYKYQVMNIYLFGCCQLLDGLHHLNGLKHWYVEFSQPDKANHYITDRNLMDMLIASHEYIFWKGKKSLIDYQKLIYQTSITTNNAVTTIPIYSNYIYDYFKHVRQGIDLIKECSRKVQVDIVHDQMNESLAYIKLTGGSKDMPSLIQLLLYEVDQISIYKDIPFRIAPLCNYLNCKIEEVINAANDIIPLTILHDVEAITHQFDPSMPFTEYIQLCSRKEQLCYKLNKLIFGASLSEHGQENLATLTKFVVELNKNPNIIIDRKQIHDIHKSLHYLFSQKLSIDDYRRHLEIYANKKKCENIVTRINLLPHVYDYLESINGNYNSLPGKLQFKFNCTSPTFPYVLVSGSNFYLSWVRYIFCQFNSILSKIPLSRGELIMFLSKCFNEMQEVNDPKAIWANICTLEQSDSFASNTSELKDLYVKLHRYLFGYHRLGNGNALRQILNQHLINLKSICKPLDVISIEILQEIFFALEYMEGSKKQFSSLQYQDFINESCIISHTNNTCNEQTSEITIKKESDEPSHQNEDSNDQFCVNSEAVPRLETTFTELEDQQNMSLVPNDHNFQVNDTMFKNIKSDIQENVEPEVVIVQNSSNIFQTDVAPNIQMIRNDCIQIHEIIPKGFAVYLKSINSGKSIVNELRELVKLEILPRKVVLVGTANDINIAKKTLRRHSESNCFKLRYRMFLDMDFLRRLRRFDVYSVYLDAMTCEGRFRNRLFKRLHTYLFGILQLCEGQQHIETLTKFLDSQQFLAKNQLKPIKKAYEYIFGVSKKRIDYKSIIQSVTSKRIM